jgi:protein-tyrosine sulfotransferase
LRYVLDSHPEMACPPESHIGRLCEDLRWTVSLALGFDVTLSTTPPSVLAQCRQTVDSIMTDYLRRVGKSRWCDKSSAIYHLPLLRSVFPEAKFICLYRNCMDVVHSGLEVSRLGFGGFGFLNHISKRLDNTVGAMVDYWCDSVDEIYRFEEANPQNTYRLRYEDLVFNPHAVLPPLFEFLGVQQSPDLLEKVFKMSHEHGPGDPNAAFSRKIHSNSVGRGSTISIRHLSTVDLERANSLLQLLNYALIGPNWDSQSSPYLPTTFSPAANIATDPAAAQPTLVLNKLCNIVNRRGIHATIKFVFEERSGETWRMIVSPESLSVQEGDAAAECEVRLALPLLQAVADGAANPMKLLRSGELRVSGDVELLRSVFQA